MLWDQLPNQTMAMNHEKTKAIQENLYNQRQAKMKKGAMKANSGAMKSQMMKAMKPMKAMKTTRSQLVGIPVPL